MRITGGGDGGSRHSTIRSVTKYHQRRVQRDVESDLWNYLYPYRCDELQSLVCVSVRWVSIIRCVSAEVLQLSSALLRVIIANLIDIMLVWRLFSRPFRSHHRASVASRRRRRFLRSLTSLYGCG